MALTDRILQEPRYGWADSNGMLVKPLLKHCLQRRFIMSIFPLKKNWITAISWIMAVSMLLFYFCLLKLYFPAKMGIFLLYAMIIMSTHGTIWFHRYCTHHRLYIQSPGMAFYYKILSLKHFRRDICTLHHVHHTKIRTNPETLQCDWRVMVLHAF